MTKITGQLIIHEIDEEEFDVSNPCACYDLLSRRYITVEHDGGDIIGVTQELIENSDHRLFKPIANRGYQVGQYKLEYIGLSKQYHKTVLFRVHTA